VKSYQLQVNGYIHKTIRFAILKTRIAGFYDMWLSGAGRKVENQSDRLEFHPPRNITSRYLRLSRLSK
jgi:hypothetical protein